MIYGNLLVTGACGYIGSYFMKHISRYIPSRKSVNYSVTLVDNMYTKRYCSLREIEERTRFKMKGFENLDIPEVGYYDKVIHLAAIADAANSTNNKEIIQRINIDETKKLIDNYAKRLDTNGFLVEKPSTLFIFPSSTSVYGKATEVISESDTDAVNPQSFYAESKVQIEEHLRKTLPNNHLILRLGTIYGVSPGMRFHTVINKFCLQAALGQPLTVWKESYEQYHPYLYISDAWDAIDGLIMNHHNGTFNVVTQNYRLSDIVRFLQTIRTDLKIEFVDEPLVNQYSYKVSIEKLRESIGFGYKHDSSVFHGIRETMKSLENVYG